MDELALIRRAQRGDAEAFNALMGAHERRMYAAAMRVCTNAQDAQDCLQDAMLHVWRSLPSYKADSSFSTWVYRITVNACLDELRRQKSRDHASLDDLVDDGWSPPSPEASPEESAVRGEVSGALMAMIRELPEDMSAAVLLRDVEGYAYEEIAARLDVSIGTVKSRISRARGRLREKIQGRPELFGD